MLHFVAIFQVASLLFIRVDNKKVGSDNRKVGVDNKKALELDNSTVSIGVDNEKALELEDRIFFSYFSLISI